MARELNLAKARGIEEVDEVARSRQDAKRINTIERKHNRQDMTALTDKAKWLIQRLLATTPPNNKSAGQGTAVKTMLGLALLGHAATRDYSRQMQ